MELSYYSAPNLNIGNLYHILQENNSEIVSANGIRHNSEDMSEDMSISGSLNNFVLKIIHK
jgi:hypothetical protein